MYVLGYRHQGTDLAVCGSNARSKIATMTLATIDGSGAGHGHVPTHAVTFLSTLVTSVRQVQTPPPHKHATTVRIFILVR